MLKTNYLKLKYQRLALAELDVASEVNLLTCDNICCCGGRTDDLGIALNFETVVRALTVEDCHHGLAIILASYYVDTIIWYKLSLLALGDNLVALTPMEQAREPVEHLVLGFGATLSGKLIYCITRESAREILAHVAIGNLLSAVHQYLCTIIELRYAIDGEQQCQCLTKSCRILAIAKETVCVVVVNECHYVGRVFVEIVVDEAVVDAV